MLTLRILGHVLLLLLFLIPLQVLGWIILLPVCLYQGVGLKSLPRAIRWFDNADIHIGRNTDTYRSVCESGVIARYWWLAFRNPTNYFDYAVLGHKVVGKLLLNSWEGTDTNVGDATDQIPGYYYQEVEDATGRIWEYYRAYKWSDTKCMRIRIGWKISNLEENIPGSIIQWVCVFQPYKDYSGK